MKKNEFFNNLAEAAQKFNTPYIASPGNVNAELFSEMGICFSSSIFLMFHNNRIGYDEMLVCLDSNDNVVAAKVTNPTQVFLITLNATKLFYKAPVKLWRSPNSTSNELIIML